MDLIYPSGRIHGLGDELSYFTAISKKVIQKIKMMFFLDYADVCINSLLTNCLLYTSPSPRDKRQSRMPSSA